VFLLRCKEEGFQIVSNEKEKEGETRRKKWVRKLEIGDKDVFLSLGTIYHNIGHNSRNNT